MKKFISLLLIFVMMLSFFGCSQDMDAPGPAVENDVPADETNLTEQTQSTQAQMETQDDSEPLSQQTETQTEITGELYLTVSKLTFSVVGESEDVYCGSLPRDVIIWESSDESVALVDNGVVTAVGVGNATVTAQFRDQKMECVIGCLANDQEELNSLPEGVLHEPKKIPPVGDGQPCHFFDDAGVIGDSVSYSLVLWAAQTGEMGTATFLVRGGNGIAGYVNRYKTINYQGLEMTIEDAVEMSGAKKLFIMIGVNDLGFMTVEETMDYFRIMMDRILERCPDVDVYLESLLPVWEDGIQGTKNADVNAYNVLLEQYAQEKGFHYVEVASYIMDHTGGMAKPYCADSSTHMNYEGIDAWMQALKLYAQTQGFEEN